MIICVINATFVQLTITPTVSLFCGQKPIGSLYLNMLVISEIFQSSN